MDIKELVGNRIRIARELKNWSKEMLAEKLDVHVSYVAKLERGVQNIGVDTLKGIAGVLGQPMSFFVEEDYTINLKQAGTNVPKVRRRRDPAKELAHE